MSAREAAEIEAFKRAAYGNDKETIDLIEDWHYTWGELETIYNGPRPHDSVSDRCRKVDSLEGQIVKHTPDTTVGMYQMLKMAAEIMAAKAIDGDDLKGAGPAFALVCRVIAGLIDREQSDLRQRAAS